MSKSYKYRSLLSEKWQRNLDTIENRHVSSSSRKSNLSVSSSTVSEFLSEKLQCLTSERDMLATYRDGLIEARKRDVVNPDEFADDLKHVVGKMGPLSEELTVLNRQHDLLDQDMTEDLEMSKKKRVIEPDIDFYERAYTSTLVPRVFQMSGQAAGERFTAHDRQCFRRDVFHRYDAFREDIEFAYCHLTGWEDASAIRAAHLVPKGLTGPEMAFLFGAQESPKVDARNGISLHTKIELALDRGAIAIVPSLSIGVWKCVLVDKSISNQTALMKKSSCIEVDGAPLPGTRPEYIDARPPIFIKWNDLDNRELVFLSDSRPARRFLYFRFVLTYLNAKEKGNTIFTSTVESKTDFWASPGPYLEKSTLTVLARNISGLELPPHLMKNTFSAAKDPSSISNPEDAAAMLSRQLRDATVESAKNWENRNRRPPDHPDYVSDGSDSDNDGR